MILLTINTSAPPGNFDKVIPANSASGISTAPILSWVPSDGADYYEYCLDTTPGSTCEASWINTNSATNVSLYDLPPNTTHYWQVRAHNTNGDTYADTEIWWSFTTTSGVVKVLLVDDDDNVPDVRAYYEDTLNTLGVLL